MPNYKPKYTSFEKVRLLGPTWFASSSITQAQVHQNYASKAESYIEGKLANKYTVPFTSSNVPPLVESMSTDLTFYYIGRRFFTQTDKDKNPWINTYKNDVDEILKDIMKGNTVLVDVNGGIIDVRTDQQEIWSNVSGYNPTMDHRDETEQRIDPDKIQDETDADVI